MRVFNEDKTQELKEYDLNLGRLIDDGIVTHHEAEIVHHEAEIIHHDAVEGIEERGHYETVAEYPNGGRDVRWVIDVEGVTPVLAWDEVVREAYDEIVKEAYDHEERIKVYVPYTKREILELEKDSIEEWLKSHDYIGIKIATGRGTVEEYADEIKEMNIKAARLNEVEELLGNTSKISTMLLN